MSESLFRKFKLLAICSPQLMISGIAAVLNVFNGIVQRPRGFSQRYMAVCLFVMATFLNIN